jgi:putative endonuclease
MGLLPSIAALFCRFSSSFFRGSAEPENVAHALGRKGEQLAARHLRRSRYKVLYQNFRPRGGGEVDIVCRDRETDELVFVEVKTRQTREYGDPADAVNREKQELIARGAIAWLRLLDFPDIPFRFDIVEVVISGGKPEIVILKNAFALPERYQL